MVQWFNDETSASAKHFIEKPLLSAEFLAEFDLLLLQNLAGWSWGSGEIALIKSWVSGGGAVVALSGHGGSGHEVLPTNELISFSGLNFSGASGMGDTALNVSECGYCLGTSHQQGGWLPEHPISFEVTAVGAFQGRSIYGTGDLVAQENGKTLGMTAPYGAGRIFLFHDDWVSYPNLWNQASTLGCESNISCSDVSPVTTYQVAQFWYNTVRYLVSEAECFTINDPVVTVK